MPDIDIVLKASDRASGPIRDVDRAVKNLDGTATTTSKGGFATLTNIMGTGLVAAAAAATAALTGVGFAIGKSIGDAAKFEQGVTDIGAVMSLTAGETENLQKHIMDLGMSPDLKVSATQAQDAIMSLGTAGLTLNQIMDGASEATVQLSNATGGDMAGSAKVLTDVMQQFNLTTENTADIVDQVTGLTVASKFGFDDVALAMAQAGGVAGSTGMEFEDFAAILGVTASNFSSGSDAGTSLKTMLTTLVPKSQEAADVMAALGLVTTDYERMAADLSKVLGEDVAPTVEGVHEAYKKTNAGAAAAEEGTKALAKAFNGLRAQYDENQFFDDTTGAMKSAEEMAGLLATAFGDLSEEQRLEAASTIFGNDAMRTAFGLIDAGTPGITKMKDEIAKVDAGGIASERMNTFAGALEIAMGVIETLSISVGQKFLPVLRPLVEQFTVLAQTHGPRLVDFFGELAGGIAKAFEEGIKWVTDVLPPLWTRMQQIGIAINEVTGRIMDLVTPMFKATDGWIKWQDVLAAVAILLTGTVVAALGSLIVSLTPVVLLVGKVALAVGLMRDAWEKNFLGIRDIAEDVLDRVAKWIDTYTGLWQGDWGRTLKFLVENGDKAWNHIESVVIEKFNYWTNEVRHVVATWVEDILGEIEFWVVNSKTKLHVWWGWVEKYFNMAKDTIVGWYEDTIGKFIPDDWEDKGRDIIQGFWDGVKGIWDGFANYWEGQWETLVSDLDRLFEFGSPSKLMERRGKWLMEGLEDGIYIGTPKALAAIENTALGIKDAWDRVMKSATLTVPFGNKPGVAANLLDGKGGIAGKDHAWLPGAGNVMNKVKAVVGADAPVSANQQLLDAMTKWRDFTLASGDELNDSLEDIFQQMEQASAPVRRELNRWLSDWKSTGDSLNNDTFASALRMIEKEIAGGTHSKAGEFVRELREAERQKTQKEADAIAKEAAKTREAAEKEALKLEEAFKKETAKKDEANQLLNVIRKWRKDAVGGNEQNSWLAEIFKEMEQVSQPIQTEINRWLSDWKSGGNPFSESLANAMALIKDEIAGVPLETREAINKAAGFVTELKEREKDTFYEGLLSIMGNWKDATVPGSGANDWFASIQGIMGRVSEPVQAKMADWLQAWKATGDPSSATAKESYSNAISAIREEMKRPVSIHNEYSITLQGSSNASADVMGLVELLGSLQGATP